MMEGSIMHNKVSGKILISCSPKAELFRTLNKKRGNERFKFSGTKISLSLSFQFLFQEENRVNKEVMGPSRYRNTERKEKSIKGRCNHPS